MFGDAYIQQIGVITGVEAKAALAMQLHEKFEKSDRNVDSDAAIAVLRKYTSYALGKPTSDEDTVALAKRDPHFIYGYLKSLSSDKKHDVYGFLYELYVEREALDRTTSAAALAAAVSNNVFGDDPGNEKGKIFASENEGYIELQGCKLSLDSQLCTVLTGAAYNVSYSRYIKAGGSRGPFSNVFLTYIRSLRRDESYHDIRMKAYGKISRLRTDILKPITSMMSLGILRSFPDSPNEREYYDAAHRYAIDAGIEFK